MQNLQLSAYIITTKRDHKVQASICRLKEQGYSPGSCLVQVDGKRELACKATLKYENNQTHRLITAIHLSRPENYLSIYQSGCNFSCRKCHSWSFSKIKWKGVKSTFDPYEYCLVFPPSFFNFSVIFVKLQNSLVIRSNQHFTLLVCYQGSTIDPISMG